MMGAPHVELAKESFEALDVCLQMQKKESCSSSSSGKTIRAALRAHLSDDHLSRLISLGLTAQEFLKRVRSSAPDTDTRSTMSPFTTPEKQLWYVKNILGVLLTRTAQLTSPVVGSTGNHMPICVRASPGDTQASARVTCRKSESF
jgi:hypothetical protein